MSGVAPIADMPSHGWETSLSAIRDRCTAEKCFFGSTNILNKAALRELRDREA